MPLFLKSFPTTQAAQEIFPLQGWQYEYLPWDAEVEVAIVQDKVASTPNSQPTYSCYSGSDLLAQAGTEATVKTTGGIEYPYDYNLQDIAAAGERIGIALSIPAGAADPATARTTVAVRVTPA